jgi:hypothetical protein
VARVRKVFDWADYDGLASVWIRQTQPYGRTRKGLSRTGEYLTEGRMQFRDRVIYSYGEHFPIANILDDKTVLITSRTFDCPMRADGRESPTTRTHIQSVKNACMRANKRLVYCEYPRTVDHVLNVRSLINDVDNVYGSILNGRNPPLRKDDIVTHEWGSYVRQCSSDNCLLHPLERLYDYIEYFDLFSQFEDDLKGLMRPGKTPAQSAVLIVEEIIRMRERIRQQKIEDRKLRRRNKYAERKARMKELELQQKALEIKRMGRVKTLTEEVVNGDFQVVETYGLSGNRAVGLKRGRFLKD